MELYLAVRHNSFRSLTNQIRPHFGGRIPVLPTGNMMEITDIWFRSTCSLEEIADILGLAHVSFDTENYWEWAIGTLVVERIQLDITRTHTEPPVLTETRKFRLDLESFTDDHIKKISLTLLPIAIIGVFWGEWRRHKGGNNFQMIESGRSP